VEILGVVLGVAGASFAGQFESFLDPFVIQAGSVPL
jgi:hypothetical protein